MQLAGEVRLALGRVSRRLRKLYADAEAGPSFLELAILNRIERQGPTHPGAIASNEGVTSAAVATGLANLEERKLIVRQADESDGRRTIVTLTAAGRKTLKGRDDACIVTIARVLDTFTAAERETLAAAVPLLERLAAGL
jgi:DNA-binding MarR family transcriptional regulator